ncbi:MAG: 2,3-bisphosphoglycerate-independent phosphoglycerate mutase [Desulfobulbaceae bacterium]|nr:2,3-bisphosphoglycerate-independent phosphoglycerate mutase [Desulfobulbaceae bacterium]
MRERGPLLLAILDGWGVGAKTETNAVYVAETPNMDRLWAAYPHTTLLAHGSDVGLPDGQMGNSEVGHLNIGAGRIVYQDYSRINRALESGEFFANEVLSQAMNKAQDSGNALHLMGLVSDGGVHSHLDHLLGLVEMAARIGLQKVFIHAFMDGRDTPPRSGLEYMAQLQAGLARIGLGQVATVSGRYYAMDRDKRWDRIELAWQALVTGRGLTAADPVQAIQDAYDRDESDEFIKPTVILDQKQQPLALVCDNDSAVFFNFRADRARQLTSAFTGPDFNDFDTGPRPSLAIYATMTVYDQKFGLPAAFPPTAMEHILGEEVSRYGFRQLRIAETEKYAHVTFFFNGGREEPYANEDRVLIPSPREVATYDLKPEMSAFQVTDELLEKLEGNDYDLIVLNLANGDMVGHSGKMAAAVKACEAVDSCVGALVEAITSRDGTVLITADHGNAEQMLDPQSGVSFTAHTTNPVPLLLVDERYRSSTLGEGGALRDIAPTVLALLGLPVPQEMDGKNLLC